MDASYGKILLKWMTRGTPIEEETLISIHTSGFHVLVQDPTATLSVLPPAATIAATFTATSTGVFRDPGCRNGWCKLVTFCIVI